MGGYMQFNYDDIEEFIFSIYKARVEIKTTMECLPARKYHTLLNELFRTLHSLKAKSFYYDFDEISSVIEKSEDILSLLLNHDCTIDAEVINWFDLMYHQLGIWLNELSDDYTSKKGLSFYIHDLDKPPSVVVVGYDINLITSHRIIILLSDSEKRKILEKILSFSFKLISTTSSLSKVSKILKESSEPRILIADIKLHDGLLTDLHNEGLLDVSTNIIILSDFKTSEELNKIKTLLKTENVFDISSTKMSDIKSIAIKSVLPADEDRIYIPLKSTKLPLESLANSINNLPKLILQIKKACFDQNTPYSEIVKLIEQDDNISSSIINRINSSYCNLGYKISDIKQAAVLLGKKKLYAAIMNSISTKIIPDVDLSMYDIAYNDIICINSLRNHLIEAWSKELKISMDNIETMITISILSSLGTIYTKGIIDNITDLFKLKEALAEQKELDKLNKTQKEVVSDKYFPPVGKTPQKYLMITEGFSAFSGISPILGRKSIGYYMLRGKVKNVLDLKPAQYMSNLEIQELCQILGIKVGAKCEDMNYEKVVILTDADADGCAIAGLIITLFSVIAPEMLKAGRICRLDTPLLTGKKNDKIVEYYFNFPKKEDMHKDVDYFYLKGLGSWTKTDLQAIIEKEGGMDNLLKPFELDKTANKSIYNWFGRETEPRKVFLRGREFHIDKA